MDLSYFSRHWRYVALALATGSGLLAGLLGWLVAASLLVATLSFLLCALIVFMLAAQAGATAEKSRKLKRQVDDQAAEIRALVSVRPLLAYPVSFGGWAMDARLAETMASLVARHRPALIAECGSGMSTVFMAACLEKMNKPGTVVALEHAPEYANATRQMLQDHGLAERATVATAPLVPHRVNGREWSWYDFESARWENRPIDLLLVDGPPETTAPLARYPALPLLKPYLADDCVIVLDDGDRDDEFETAHRWAQESGGELEYVAASKGGWILRC